MRTAPAPMLRASDSRTRFARGFGLLSLGINCLPLLTCSRRQHRPAGKNALELFVDVVHLVGMQREVLSRVSVAVGEIYPQPVSFAASTDVFIHKASELNEWMIANPYGITVEGVRSLLHRLNLCVGVLRGTHELSSM